VIANASATINSARRHTVSPRGSLVSNENFIATTAYHFHDFSKLPASIGMGNKFL
jgi:hypothetical protein